MLHFDNITIDNKVIQLQSGFRIFVGKIQKQKDGTYLARGTEQIAGMFWYRNLDNFVLYYGQDQKLIGIYDLE